MLTRIIQKPTATSSAMPIGESHFTGAALSLESKPSITEVISVIYPVISPPDFSERPREEQGSTCGGCMVVFSTKSHVRTAEVLWRRAQDACLMLRNPLPSKIPAVLIELRPAQTTTASTATHRSPINPPKR